MLACPDEGVRCCDRCFFVNVRPWSVPFVTSVFPASPPDGRRRASRKGATDTPHTPALPHRGLATTMRQRCTNVFRKSLSGPVPGSCLMSANITQWHSCLFQSVDGLACHRSTDQLVPMSQRLTRPLRIYQYEQHHYSHCHGNTLLGNQTLRQSETL